VIQRPGKKLKIRKSFLFITGHSLERFKERWRAVDEFDRMPTSEDEWRQKFEMTLRRSREVELPKLQRVHQLINYGREDVRFFNSKNGEWRFVAFDDERDGIVGIVIVTSIWKGREYRPSEEEDQIAW